VADVEPDVTESIVYGTLANGMVPSGPRLPRREMWLDLPPEYPDFRVKVWVNYPRRLNDELKSGDEQRLVGVLRQIMLEHNGWSDADGTPFPPPTTEEFWAAIPNELLAAMVVAWSDELGKVNTSLMTRSGR
jgi:hypothetical protein